MTDREIICVTCPVGCTINIRANNGQIVGISGNECKRGEEYAVKEYTNPVRVLTSTVRAEGYVSPVISVRTKEAIPKDKMAECMEIIKGLTVTEPFYDGRVVIENIVGTGVDLILSNY